MKLEFGIWDHFERQEGLPLHAQYEQRIKLVQAAEGYGFSRYHVAEHHLTPLDLAPSPMLYLAALARETSTIRLGSMVLCLPLYQPVRLIQEICMLDHLSGGRFELGVGRGVRDVEHEWLGLNPAESQGRYEETLQLLLSGLRTQRLDFHGQYFNFDDVALQWWPAQRPHPPLWYAGRIASAAAQGMNALGRNEDRAAFDAYWQVWQERRAAGDPRYQFEPRVGSTRHIVVADTDEEALALARRAWPTYMGHFFATSVRVGGRPEPAGGAGSAGRGNLDEQLANEAFIVGSPSTVRDKLVRYLDQVWPLHNYLVAAVQWGDLTHAEAMRSLQLYATEVVPALAERATAAAAV